MLKCYWVELIVSSTFGFVVISLLSVIGSLVFMSLNIEISFSKCISLGIGGGMNLKKYFHFQNISTYSIVCRGKRIK